MSDDTKAAIERVRTRMWCSDPDCGTCDADDSDLDLIATTLSEQEARLSQYERGLNLTDDEMDAVALRGRLSEHEADLERLRELLALREQQTRYRVNAVEAESAVWKSATGLVLHRVADLLEERR